MRRHEPFRIVRRKAEQPFADLPREIPATVASLGARPGRDVLLAPSFAPVLVAELDDERLEALEGPVGQPVRRDQRQPCPIQRDLADAHAPAPSAVARFR